MPVIINSETYYTTKELSVKFNVTMETINDWRQNKGLKFFKVSKRKFMSSEKQVEDFIKGK